MANNVRQYGLGDSTPFVRGVPTVKDKVPGVCPNCGCESIYQLEVQVENPQLRGGQGKGEYVGCPACPWASPMLMTAQPKAPTKES